MNAATTQNCISCKYEPDWGYPTAHSGFCQKSIPRNLPAAIEISVLCLYRRENEIFVEAYKGPDTPMTNCAAFKPKKGVA